MESDLGLTPNNDGQIIRLPVPELTEERRKEMVRLVHKMAEEARVAVRNVRRDVLNEMKRAEKSGELSRDELAGPGRGPEAHRRRGEGHRRPDGAQRGRDPRGLTRRDDQDAAAHGLLRPRARPRGSPGAARRPHRRPLRRWRSSWTGTADGPATATCPWGRPPRGRAGAEAGRARPATPASRDSRSSRSRPRTGRAPSTRWTT